MLYNLSEYCHYTRKQEKLAAMLKVELVTLPDIGNVGVACLRTQVCSTVFSCQNRNNGSTREPSFDNRARRGYPVVVGYGIPFTQTVGATDSTYQASYKLVVLTFCIQSS